jgi:transcriptional regulator with XRE-family HTH domain
MKRDTQESGCSSGCTSAQASATETIFSRIRTLREDRGWSRDYLAKILGCSRSTLQNYETASQPKLEVLIHLSQIFGCSLDWLATGHGTNNLVNSSRVARKEEDPKAGIGYEVKRNEGSYDLPKTSMTQEIEIVERALRRAKASDAEIKNAILQVITKHTSGYGVEEFKMVAEDRAEYKSKE